MVCQSLVLLRESTGCGGEMEAVFVIITMFFNSNSRHQPVKKGNEIIFWQSVAEQAKQQHITKILSNRRQMVMMVPTVKLLYMVFGLVFLST